MSQLFPASLIAFLQYYLLLWRSPCFTISARLFASESPVLLVCYKVVKWIQRTVLQQGSELSRLSGGSHIRRLVEQDPTLQASLAGPDDEQEETAALDESSDEVRLLHARETRKTSKDTAIDVNTVWKIDYSISHSRALKAQAKSLVSSSHLSDILATICREKQVPRVRTQQLRRQIERISTLNAEIQESLVKPASEQYKPTDLAYRAALRELWKSLQYDSDKVDIFDEDNHNRGEISILSTKEWQDLGFQGADPSTDWRSSGKLGLRTMLYFSKLYSRDNEARQMVEQAVKGIAEGSGDTNASGLGWYPFALSCITVVDFLLRLIPLHSLVYVFLSSPFIRKAQDSLTTEARSISNGSGPSSSAGPDKPSSSTEQTFHHIASLLIRHFHEHWIYLQTSENPEEANVTRPMVMDYERISRKWKIEVRKWLERGKIGGWVDSRGLVFLDWQGGDSSLDLDVNRLLQAPKVTKASSGVESEKSPSLPQDGFYSPSLSRQLGQSSSSSSSHQSFNRFVKRNKKSEEVLTASALRKLV